MTERHTTRFPKGIIDDLDQLVEDGVFPSRSEAIRHAVLHIPGVGVDMNSSGLPERDRPFARTDGGRSDE